MKNSELQRKLNEQKWYVSEAKGKDQSGKMDWCKSCNYQKENSCAVTELDRGVLCLCATAYNRMVREKAKNGKEKSTD